MMIISKAVGGVRKRFGFSRPIAVGGPHSPDQFQTILVRERARADRTGEKLSLIAFTSAKGSHGAETMAGLVRILAGRLRTTDDFGWLGAEGIGAVLPGTSGLGARKVAEDVISSLPCAGAAPSWQVYCYPSEEPPSEFPWEEKTGGRHAGTASGNGRAVCPMETFFVSPTAAWKRGLDMVGALLGLMLLSPLFAVVAAAIKATSPGPVFHRQKRSGRGGKPFVLYKFRSMVVGAEAQKKDLAVLNEWDGPVFKIRNDPRVTVLGRFLRSTSLDELPQLWNVLKGDMSLVGPRPLVCEESDACQGWQRRRLEATPGLTCFSQISDRSKISFDEWVRMDVQYIRSRSLGQDFKLLLRTAVVVLRGGGW